MALAWEVRKTSPGKLHLANREQGSPCSVDLSAVEESTRGRHDGPSNSWADLVKGMHSHMQL